MGYLDSLNLKPAPKVPAVVDLKVEGNGKTLALIWEDKRVTTLGARTLRQLCPCAACVDEWTHQRTLDPASVPEDVTLTQVQPIGNYALGLGFSDQHSSGIFNWSYLREISERPRSE